MPKVGEIRETVSGLKYQIIAERKVKDEGRKPYKIFRVRFINTGYEVDVRDSGVARNIIKDYLEKTISNVAAIGYASISDNPKAFAMWQNMIRRCNNPNDAAYHLYGKKGVQVCERWLRFDNFLEDLPLIDGYDEELFQNGEIVLDKDKKQFDLSYSERVYSLNTCVFISQEENNKFRNYEKGKKEFVAISPEGKSFKVVGIREFAKKYGLNHAAILMCIGGERKTHKGWEFYSKTMDN